ncbi:MAG: hypothetical protein R6X06_12385 [Gammaproteobacteria bacterium]
MDKDTLPEPLRTTPLPDWVRWLAQDGDGAWWGYEVEPLERDHGWYENEVGRHIRLHQGAPETQWRTKLYRLK